MQHDDSHNALLAVGSALSSSLDAEESLAAVAREIGRAMDVWSVDIWGRSRDHHTAAHEAYWCRDDATPGGAGKTGAVVNLDKTETLRRVIEGGVIVEWNIDDPALNDQERESMKASGCQTTVGAPLLIGKEVVGALLMVETRAVRRLTEEERGLVGQMSRLAALGVRGSELARRRGEQDGRRLAILHSSHALATATSEVRAVESVRGAIADLLGCSDCRVGVHLCRENDAFVHLETTTAEGVDSVSEVDSPTPDPIVLRALEGRRALQARGSDERTRIIVPLLTSDDVAGYIDVSGRLPRQMVADDVEFLQILANQTTAAVENGRLMRAVKRQAATDGVSGLYNRWYFFERLYSEAARALRYKEPLALMMVVVDDFEGFRRKWGSDAGDTALRAMGRLVNVSLRSRVDVACRVGGGEFAILLPNTPSAVPGAGLVAERLRRTVEKTEIRSDDHEFMGRFTLSIGIAGFPGNIEDADELAAAADEALHAAIRAGGNRVKLHG
jgi:diguanylate cyclase (GGDEF)-like protein